MQKIRFIFLILLVGITRIPVLAQQAQDSLAVIPKDSVSHIEVGDSSRITAVKYYSKSALDSIVSLYKNAHKQELDSLLKLKERYKTIARRRLVHDMYTDKFRNKQIHVCAIDPVKTEIRLFNKKGKRGRHTFSSIEELAKAEGKTLIFAMNAGMYEKNRLAKGLYIADGTQYKEVDTLRNGKGNFYMQPNGVFAIDSLNKAYVITTSEYSKLKDSLNIKLATQSGPMLIVNGEINAHFNDGSPNLHIRNAVGITAENEIIFAISQTPVTFYELSRVMIQNDCVNALYLDGAICKAYMPQIKVGSLAAGEYLGPILGILWP